MNAPAPTGFDGPDVDQDALRAGTWSLLGSLLAAAPDDARLALLRGIEGRLDDDADGMARAWLELRDVAGRTAPEAVTREYHKLFIGVGGGEIIPYASYYLAGALLERPLILLRQDLQALGVERQAGVSEPEDHVAAICEVMALLIGDPTVAHDWQHTFFQRHVECWMARLFQDLQYAPSADFYQAVGRLGEAFVHLEKRYFSMPA